MVDLHNFKKKIEQSISQEYKVEFLGKNFDKIVTSLTDIKAEKMYRWVEDVIKENIQPIMIASKKSYKEWRASELLTFRYPFTIGNTEYRIMFVKVRNSIYIEFHLGDHKYYDKVRKDLDLKKTSY
jgi:hypothetical protein